MLTLSQVTVATQKRTNFTLQLCLHARKSKPSSFNIKPSKLLHQRALSNAAYFLSNKHCNCMERVCKRGGKAVNRFLRLSSLLFVFLPSILHSRSCGWVPPALPSAWHTIMLVPLINPGEIKLPWVAPSLQHRRGQGRRDGNPFSPLALFCLTQSL